MKPWCLTNTHPECGAWAHKTAKQNVIFSTASVSEKIPNLEQWNQQNAREQIGEQHVSSWAILVLFVVVFLRSNVTVKMKLFTHKIQQGFMFVKLILVSCVCHSSSQVVLRKGLLWCSQNLGQSHWNSQESKLDGNVCNSVCVGSVFIYHYGTSDVYCLFLYGFTWTSHSRIFRS